MRPFLVRLVAVGLILQACGVPSASTIAPIASPSAPGTAVPDGRPASAGEVSPPSPTAASPMPLALELDPPLPASVDAPIKMLVTGPPGAQIECSVTSASAPPPVTITMNATGRAVCRQIRFAAGSAGQTVTFVARITGEEPFGRVSITLPGALVGALPAAPGQGGPPAGSANLPPRSITVDTSVVHMDEYYVIRIYGYPAGTTALLGFGTAGNVFGSSPYTFDRSPGIFTTSFLGQHAADWHFGTPYLHTFTFADGTVLSIPVTVIR